MNIKEFLKKKNIVISAKRYGIDALGAMAQGLFASLLIGTILNTLGTQLHIPALSVCGGYATSMSGAAMAIAIGYALQSPPLVLFSLATVGHAANALGGTTLSGGSGAGGPLAVLFIAIIAAECGKAVSKETRVDILVTPLVTILVGVGLSALIAPAIGTAASSVGSVIMWATDLQPFLMGIVVSVVVGIALTLPISSAAICAALGLTGLAVGRPGLPGNRHLHAADGQHREKSQDLDSPDRRKCCHRSDRDLHLPPSDERTRQRRSFRYGHLRSGRPDRRLRRLGSGRRCRHQGRYYTHGLDRADPDLLRPSRNSHSSDRNAPSQGGLDQGRRSQASVIKFRRQPPQ